MEDSYFIYNYKKNMIKHSLILGLALIFSLVILFSGLSTFNKNFTSPLIIREPGAYSTSNLKDKYIRINLTDIKDLNSSEYVRSGNLGTKVGEFNSGQYIALGFNNKIIIANLSQKYFDEFMTSDPQSYTLKGIVKELSEDNLSSIKSSLENAGFSEAQLNSLVFKNYVQVMSPLESAAQPIITSIIIFIITCTMFAYIYLQNSKILNSLNGFSSVYPDLIYDEIDKELTEDSIYVNGPITVTQNYLLVVNDLLVAAIPICELVWVYKKPDKFYKDKCIMKSHRLFFMLSNNIKFSVNYYHYYNELDDLLSYLSAHCPKTILGYSQDIEDALRKNSKVFLDKWSSLNL